MTPTAIRHHSVSIRDEERLQGPFTPLKAASPGAPQHSAADCCGLVGSPSAVRAPKRLRGHLGDVGDLELIADVFARQQGHHEQSNLVHVVRWPPPDADVSQQELPRCSRLQPCALGLETNLCDAEIAKLKQLNRWSQAQHERFNIGYVALHGSPGTVHIGRYVVRLEAIADRLPSRGLASKVLHFGSCSVLDMDENDQQELRRLLGVRALTGFTQDVDWFESMAFELLLFEALTSYKRPSDAEKYLMRRHGELSERLGFTMVR